MTYLSAYARRINLTRIDLFNPNHDAKGLFATGGGVAGAIKSTIEFPVHVEHAVKAAAGKALNWIKSKAPVSAPAPNSLAGKVGDGVSIVAKTGLKAYFAPWVAGRKAVEAVARAKGLNPKEVARVSDLCTCYDAINCKAVFFGLEHAGFPHAAAASLFIPTASIVYLAHAAASNPAAVFKAATAAVKSAGGKIKSGLKKIGLSNSLDAQANEVVGILADAYKRHAGDEGFAAIMPLAMESSDSVSDAVVLAEKALLLFPKNAQ